VAKRFYLSQSTVSKRLKRIEDELGTTLIDRGPRSVAPTEEGMLVYEAFKDIIARYDLLETSLAVLNRERRGELSVGVLYHGVEELAAPFVREFKKICPNVRVRYVPCQNYQVIERLESGKIDVGVTAASLSNEGEMFSRDGRLAYTPVCPQLERCAVSSKSPLAGCSSVSKEQLRDLTFVCMTDEGLTASLARDVFGCTRTVDAGQIDMVPMMLAEDPDAFALIDDLTARRFSGTVASIPFEEPMLGLTYCYVCRKDDTNPLVSLFLKTISEQG
jgi:DNA-binding transcriptional LysR family regulator